MKVDVDHLVKIRVVPLKECLYRVIVLPDVTTVRARSVCRVTVIRVRRLGGQPVLLRRGDPRQVEVYSRRRATQKPRRHLTNRKGIKYNIS